MANQKLSKAARAKTLARLKAQKARAAEKLRLQKQRLKERKALEVKRQRAAKEKERVRRMKLKDTLRLGVLRGTDRLNYSVTVIEREDDPQRFADMVNPDDNLISKLGILGIEINKEISAMLPDLRHEYGIVVAARASNPPYSGAALEVGDVIYQINGTPTATVQALRSTLDGMKPGDSAVLQIERSSRLLFATIELE